jgi:hypothetical protein
LRCALARNLGALQVPQLGIPFADEARNLADECASISSHAVIRKIRKILILA